MDILNTSFLEEYKRLDKLCREMYQADRGVTSYIDDMKMAQALPGRLPDNWNSDFQKLYRMRKLRNQLTHEIGTLDAPLCTQSDIDWLREFRERIFQTSDPLALLSKVRESGSQLTGISHQNDMVLPASSSCEERIPVGCLIVAIFGILAVIAVLLLWGYLCLY